MAGCLSRCGIPKAWMVLLWLPTCRLRMVGSLGEALCSSSVCAMWVQQWW